MKGKVTLDLGKKLFIGALAMLGFVTQGNAQVSYNLGVCGGPQATNVSSDIGSFKTRIGFNAGIAQELRIGKYFAIELDELYSVHIADRSYSDSINFGVTYAQKRDVKTSEQFSYAETHLLFKLNIPIGSKPIIPYDRPDYQKTWLSIYAGPYYATLLNYTRSGKITSTRTYLDTSMHNQTVITETGDASDKEREGVYKTDIGVTAGLGINFRLNDHWVFNIDARYSKGFSSIDAGFDGAYDGFYQGYFGTFAPSVAPIAHKYPADPPFPAGTVNIPAKQYVYANMTNSAIALNIGLKYQFGK